MAGQGLAWVVCLLHIHYKSGRCPATQDPDILPTLFQAHLYNVNIYEYMYMYLNWYAKNTRERGSKILLAERK
jgi:hypothetical protein